APGLTTQLRGAFPRKRSSELHRGREVLIDDQDQLAAGVTLLNLAVRGRGVLPVVPAGNVDVQRPVVEPRSHPDQAAAARLPVVMLPADPVGVRVGGLANGGGDHGAVEGGAGGAGQGRRRDREYLSGAAAGYLADQIGPVGPVVIDDHGCTAHVHELMVLRAGGRDYGRAERAGDL